MGAIWLKSGDENSKFFHQFSNGRKAINTIWSLKDQQGNQHHNFHQLAQMGIDHFRDLYKAPANTNLAEIIRVARLFPRFVDQEAEDLLMKPVTLQELEDTLKWFQRDKSPGLDGWPIEFYLAFFDVMGQDILNLIE